jgi:hypothetical protein
MANITTTLSMVSSDAFAHQPINLTVSHVNTTMNSPYTDVSRLLAPTSTVKNILGTTGVGATGKYLYIKNVKEGAATRVTVRTGANTTLGILKTGEFMFLVVAPALGISVQATAGDAALVEYLYWTNPA